MTGRQVLPTISVIIPAFNAARYLGDAVASVRAQTLQATEIIVVDNGSTDGTPGLAAELGVRCEHEPRLDTAFARNRGLAAAVGDFFALLDADDLWTARKLEWQMALMDADPQLEAVFGLMEHFISPDLPPAEAAQIYCPPEVLPARLPSLMLIRRSAFERVGPFSGEMPLGDIVEWSVRALSANLRFSIAPHVVMRRRLHATNKGRSMTDQRADYVRIVKQKLDRERATGK